ncbi:MAG: aspartate aminotransferase family protein [Saprospiraceae bacterium]|nr:aspartate aminotransferase family protein [Saprospiraceae bacterium]MCF8250022.1 aspartate aminotransferase family protein [Saprospiraceae bacterium]MCF8278938.1 aspartate aminotransferase family protein [Bacteroidales bacterium]MCF8311035.1 aspartate aminotransferase family protein [Saprospiraceae bacterium]MCF8439629.1 aspartate aminotransferase family protein [Saprospiraceae bacterium]
MIASKTKSEELLDRRRSVVASGVGLFNAATAQSAKGAIVVDADGRELIDFAGGIGVVNAGHCPDSVVEAIIEQARKFIHTSFNVTTYEPYIALCEKLVEILPHDGPTKVMLASTGAEAVENAIKIARQATHRDGILCYTEAFHGRTMMAMTLTSKVAYKMGCGPFAPEVYRTAFPNYYHYGTGIDEDTFATQELYRLDEYLKSNVGPEDLAAIIIELVQGEGGFNVAPKKYVQGLRKLCDQYGIMLIFDEVQSGFCRTGAWGAYEHFGVLPDISTWAKSMGSGMPIAAVIGRAKVMDAAGPSTIGGTYIGNPVCSAAALATIKFMEENDLNARGVEVGNIVRERFELMKSRYPSIGDVRGLGAMMAMEFVKNGDPLQPDGDLCIRIMEGCLKNGLIIINAGTYKNILRLLSPLVITNEQLHKGLDILETEIQRATN